MNQFKIKYRVRIYADPHHEECIAVSFANDLMVALAFIGTSPYWELRDGEEEHDGVTISEA